MSDERDKNLETSDKVLRRGGQTKDSWHDRPRTDADSPRPEGENLGESPEEQDAEDRES